MLAEDEQREELDLWERIRGEYLRHGLATVGAEDVLGAAKQGRVEQALINSGCKIDGMRCRSCEELSAGLPEACPACGSDSLFEIDLVNEIVELLELSSARSEFADPIPGLAKLGDIAAMLRY